MLFEACNGQIPLKLFALKQYWLDATYLHLFCLIIFLTMSPLAVTSLILTGSQCLTAYGSHVSKVTTDCGIHAHKRTHLPTLAYKTMNKENNTYLLGTEDVSEIYNRLLRASHITVCSKREGECVTHFCPKREGGQCKQHCVWKVLE